MNKTFLARLIFPVFFLLVITPFSYGQKNRGKAHTKGVKHAPSSLSAADLETYKNRIRQMVSFLEYALNTLGNDSLGPDDKEPILKSSYLKVFDNPKVQIEDDLDENRKVITNKDVQAYLQDVDYFFKDVHFEFRIENIDDRVNERNEPYFFVTLNRVLKGVTISGETISNNKPRYLEINIDPKRKELKIISMYTTGLSEEEELKKWWTQLPSEWKIYFQKNMGMDSVSYGSLKRLMSTEEIDISNNKTFSEAEPLARFTKLKKVNLSNTNISSAQALRNLFNLEYLNLSNTAVTDLNPVKYADQLKELYINNTQVNTLELVANFPKIETLQFSGTKVTSLEPLATQTTLINLQFTNTEIADLSPLKNLLNLQVLDFSDTRVTSIEPLANLSNLREVYFINAQVQDLSFIQPLKKLQVINFNNNPVASLQPLKNIESLERVYCEKTKVSRDEATQFMTERPQVLVIYESEELLSWWNSLTSDWKKAFRRYPDLSEPPSREQLAALTNLTAIDITGNEEINSLEPLKVIKKLKEVKLNNTDVTSLNPLKDLYAVQVVEFSGTGVNSLDPLWNLSQLKRVNCNNTLVDSAQIKRFIQTHPKVLIVYKSSRLSDWWTRTPMDYKNIFRQYVKMDDSPTEIQLHELTQRDSLTLNNKFLLDLNPLSEFTNLKVLRILNSQVKDLTPLKQLKKLIVLEVANCPVADLKPVSELPNIKVLSVYNTAVDGLEFVKKLKQLEYLNVSGTKVGNVRDLKEVNTLKGLNISNTSVCGLRPLKNSKMLKQLICFNSHISKRQVSRFQKEHPLCEITYY